ncbi:histidine phosphatase family protein [Fictibacillus sp. FJAT-27399]|uniref:histidine phosphatase family protein n=1 Tax=Fictibacillus sp. FJAT-27399 TaxID=1729689 RepID=UPI00078484A0|nr:histidine phosphatase family protein [Fictibacillus sp. FJAT-27399]
MAKIYLLRHGVTEWNAAGDRYCGLTDIDLSKQGGIQAECAAAYLKDIKFDAAYSSTLCRAYNTAQIIAKKHYLSVQKDDRIVEADFGLWEGKTRTEFEQEDPQSWEAWVIDPKSNPAGKTGETAEKIFSRMKSFFDEISKNHPDETVLVVAHSTVNRIYIAGALEMPFKHYRRLYQENTGINIFDLEKDSFKLLHMNVAEHLND